MKQMTRNERLLRLARLRGDRAAELIVSGGHTEYGGRLLPRMVPTSWSVGTSVSQAWTEAELRAAWGDR